MRLGILLVLVALGCGSCSPGGPYQPMAVLETGGVENAYPRLSRDGNKILFQSNASGKWQICMMRSDGSEVNSLTADSVNSFFADWSPDNTMITFTSDRTGNEEIYLMDSDGHNVRQLTSNKALNIHPYFSPDGKHMYFSSTLGTDGNLEIYRMNLDGTGLSRITRTADDESCARIASDLSQMVFLRNNRKGLDDIFTRSLLDSAEVNVTNTAARDGWPCWTPDGKGIVYAAMEDEVFKLYMYDLNEKTRTRLTNPSAPYNDCRPSFSADGQTIVFNRESVSETGKTNAIYMLQL